MNTVKLECACGAVKGTLDIVPGSFFHVQCLCNNCQRFIQELDNPNIMDEFGGTDLLQTYPAYMEIHEGRDQICALQLKPKGLYRWYTACCHTPIANTMRKAKVPFVGVPVKFMKFRDEQEKTNILGPLTLKAFGQYAIGEKPADVHPRFPFSYLPKIIAFMIKGKIKRKYKPSPFFNEAEPVIDVKLLLKETNSG